MTVLFGLSPLRNAPFFALSLYDAKKALYSKDGSCEIVVRSADKVSSTNGPPVICFPSDLVPAFKLYRTWIKGSFTSCGKKEGDV